MSGPHDPSGGGEGTRFDGPWEDDEDPWADDGDLGDERLGLDGGAAVGRAPICGLCGVTMLPADPSNVIDADFVCDNEDCENFRSA